ncbi:Calcium-dependent protein kinase 4 [Physocladia obscura]|uniref:Calcium-dependent protein kinase 4 n=1 Tax=Physocladia obscura TaxID=109957 RepID=A0AAD5SSE3_9FUNG|nr:Calcium-dependent protein kinase 4 [Physocladia obscura]
MVSSPHASPQSRGQSRKSSMHAGSPQVYPQRSPKPANGGIGAGGSNSYGGGGSYGNRQWDNSPRFNPQSPLSLGSNKIADNTDKSSPSSSANGLSSNANNNQYSAKIAFPSSPSAFSVRGPSLDGRDVVYIVEKSLHSASISSSPKNKKDTNASLRTPGYTPKLNTTNWYKSPHGFRPIDEPDNKNDDYDDENTMDDLVLDSDAKAAAPLQNSDSENENADADVEAQRLTFASLIVSPSSLKKKEKLTAPVPEIQVGSVPQFSSPTPPIPKKFQWPHAFLNFGTKLKINPIDDTDQQPQQIGSPLAFLKLIEDSSIPSREKKQEYKVIKELGKGVQGVVTLRIHIQTNTRVAVKVISVYSSIDESVRKSFRREVAILKQVAAHPNIMRLVDYWEGKNKVYQVFEFCSGGDLVSGLEYAALSEPQSAQLIYQLIDVIRHLHQKEVLHRDVRPANVLLRRKVTGTETLAEISRVPVLADFGIATYEQLSGRMGTQFIERPPHIAPEVVDGARFSKPADMFGIGVCLITILLHRPIEISDQNPRLVSREKAWAVLSVEGKRFLRKLLEIDPQKRVTAEDALQDDWFTVMGVHVK